MKAILNNQVHIKEPLSEKDSSSLGKEWQENLIVIKSFRLKIEVPKGYEHSHSALQIEK